MKHATYLPSIYNIDQCAGYLGMVKKACEAKGCCWLPLLDLEQPLRGGPQLEQPACFYTNTAPSLYQATDVNRTKKHTEVSNNSCLWCNLECFPPVDVMVSYLDRAATGVPCCCCRCTF